MFFILILILLGAVSAYREAEQFKRDGSWKEEEIAIRFWKNLKIFGKEIKNTDSFHFMGGLWWLIVIAFIIIEGVWIYLNGDWLIEVWLLIISKEIFWVIVSIILNIIIYWQAYMWFRNAFLLVFFRSKNYKRWKYLFPLVALWDLLDKK